MRRRLFHDKVDVESHVSNVLPCVWCDGMNRFVHPLGIQQIQVQIVEQRRPCGSVNALGDQGEAGDALLVPRYMRANEHLIFVVFELDTNAA